MSADILSEKLVSRPDARWTGGYCFEGISPKRRNDLKVLRSRGERHLAANAGSAALLEGVDYTGMSYHGEFAVDARAAHLNAISAEVVEERAELAAWEAEWLAQDEAERMMAAEFTEEEDAHDRAYDVIVDLANMSDGLDFEGWRGFHITTAR